MSRLYPPQAPQTTSILLGKSQRTINTSTTTVAINTHKEAHQLQNNAADFSISKRKECINWQARILLACNLNSSIKRKEHKHQRIGHQVLDGRNQARNLIVNLPLRSNKHTCRSRQPHSPLVSHQTVATPQHQILSSCLRKR